jgi:outer membrane protein assembly factor BamB
MSLRRIRTVGAVLAVLVAAGAAPAARAVTLPTASTTADCTKDWPTYGAGADHTFNNASCLDPVNIHTLAPQWFFKTGDAVTANPVVVGNRVYVGSWDGNFYAIDKTAGTQVWKYTIKPQPAVVPHPGPLGRQFDPADPSQEFTSDGGLITSSAWYEPAGPKTQGKNLVIFAGGYTLYALDADTGAEVWTHDYTGRPDLPADPDHDGARIFSSPVVVGTKVIFGVSVDGQNNHRGYVAAANIENGEQVWRFETDVDPVSGLPRNDGCGSVWSSGTLVRDQSLIVFDTADCDFSNGPSFPFDEVVFALHVGDGSLAWKFDPPRPDKGCDWDFGASANHGFLPNGTEFLGVGGKDGTYYSLDPATGNKRWATNVVFGGLAGGFIGTTAFDGQRVYGATSLGAFNNMCDTGNPRETPVQEPSMHAFDAAGGAVAWQGVASQAFAPTTVAGGMTFLETGFTHRLQIRDKNTGVVLLEIPLAASGDGSVSVVGKSIFFGTGGPEQFAGAGVYSFTAVG